MAFNIDAVDTSAKTDGIWEEFKGSKFLIASTSKGAYQRRMSTLRKPYARALDKGTADPDTMNTIFCKALSEQILLDWKGVKDGKGTEVPYSREVAQKVLENDDTFKDFVLEVAGDQALFEREFKDDAVKK